MPNAITTRYINETQYSENAHFSGDTQVSGNSNNLVTLSMPDNMRHSSMSARASDNTQRMNTQEINNMKNREGSSDNKPQRNNNRNKNNRKATIITVAIIVIAAVGLGLFLLLHSRDSGVDDTVINNNGEYYVNDINGDVDADYIQGMPLEISSIVLLYSGRVQTEFHTRVGETITLRAQLLPDGLDYDVSWESSDPDVLEISQVGQAGLEATITGLFPGVADIVVTAGNFEMYYIVFVDDYPLHAQLEAAIDDEIEGVWLTILWTSGEHNGQETSFLRARNDDTWIMHGVTDTREVYPIFNMEANAFTIGFPNTARIYYLFADGTGYFREPDGAYAEDFIWWFAAADTDIEG